VVPEVVHELRDVARGEERLGELLVRVAPGVGGRADVTDMGTAFAAAGPVRKEAYGSPKPDVASTILVTPRLALPQQLIEIKLIAKV
jgi:hypothetical protein